MATLYPWQLGDDHKLLQYNVFSDGQWLGKDCYDSGNTEFVDFAGYDHWRTGDFIGPRAKISAGTPTFVDVGTKGRRALRLDQSCHLQILPPNVWHGSLFMLFKPTFGSAIIHPLVFGNATTNAAQPNVRIVPAGTRMEMNSSSFQSSAQVTGITSGNIYCAVLSWDEENRRTMGTHDGTTVGSGTQLSDVGYGRLQAQQNSNSFGTDAVYCRVGDNDRAGGTSASGTDYIDLIEMGWLQNNPVDAALADTKSMIETLVATV